MSHAHDHDPTVPKEALIAAGALLLVILGLTGAVTSGLMPQEANPEASRAASNVAPAEQRDLHFADRDDGAVVISDHATGETVKVIGYGEEGFTRATLRRLAKRRAAAGIGAEPPFTLTRWENGALSLHDPQTGEHAEIHGYGADHSAAFAELLEGAKS
ncbi:photosynthetic complex assembly protein PuhC [Pontixanthobacter aestiaquae]|uniref:Photosynthetic complex assembly protein n=1 Tax=Pontixanthobacter aestiaquae TaxID=1509367 RepID=A0A844Z9M1_9SPHN|nr:photosynthetic complex assembly protein PuhC [Pontixanthobacter aestiaquae]MDN3644789.1 photosynthetic complex assembly protein PuhC [Pontixanthobacter aestiaquae]MXO84204.1 photosynthetic complex assembly protein [Pontixanthobacter aestiaquae]